MITKLRFEKNEETFKLLKEFLPGYNKDRTQCGIGLKLKTREACEIYASQLGVSIAKIETEHKKLQHLATSYNTTYPSENKDCLTMAHYLSNTIKNSITETKKSILKFCPRNRYKSAGMYSTPTQTLSASYLCNKTPYMRDMFSELFPDYIKDVLDLLDKYMNIIIENICLSTELMKEEDYIRNNDELLKEIEHENRKDIEKEAIFMKNNYVLNPQCISKEDLERRKMNAKDISILRREQYHNINRSQYMMYVFKDVIMQGMENELSAEEAEIWTVEEDYDFVKQEVRIAIERISKSTELPNRKKPRTTNQMVKAEYIAEFVIWCRVPDSHISRFLAYLKTKFSDSPFVLPEDKSVYGQLRTMSKNEYEFDFKACLSN